MPIYEYQCQACRRKQSFLVRKLEPPFQPACKACGSEQMTRLLSSVALLRSEEARLDSLADPARWGGIDENDPGSVQRFVKQMGSELGEDLGEDLEGLEDDHDAAADDLSATDL
ncbi:MAG: zinc ribbon domain-containing protein [Gemmatimonadetes bacterium]|nr:zinc ribbon domain-containing protein [Gemmatimonadota bacterium]